MAKAITTELEILPFYSWPDRMGVGFPLTALVWSWIMGNSMRLVYLPWAPYAMLALTVWVMVLTTRLCEGADKWRFPGGRWAMGAAIFCSVAAILYMAFFVVGFGIIEFAFLPAALLVIYTLNQLLLGSSGKLLLFTYFVGGMAFSYGCAVPVWYSAAVYSWPLFVVDQRNLYLGFLIFIFLMTKELWRRERQLAYTFDYVDWEEEDARLVVWVAVPLLILVGLCLYLAYSYGSTTAWVFYCIAISAALMYVLNKYREHFSLIQLRWLMFVVLVIPGLFQLFL